MGRNTRKRHLAILVAALALLVLALAVAAIWILSPTEALAKEGGLFEVRKGETASSLAGRLEREGFIRSALALRLLAKVESVEGRLKAGTYAIEARMGSQAILSLLTSGKQALLKVTLPEGLSLGETARRLETEGVVSAPSFLGAATDARLLAELGIPGLSAEGYLFPDTYYLPRDFGAEATLRLLVSTFRERFSALPGAEGLGPAAVAKAVILASIIEREYRLGEEAPLIGSVFANRLRIGMPLQSCATVVYIITETQRKPHPEVIYDRDLAIQDPYNTYLNRGLPPGPIASPGLVALKAALQPPTTPWLYFRLVDADTGQHHFSTTFEEHLGAARLVIKRASGT